MQWKTPHLDGQHASYLMHIAAVRHVICYAIGISWWLSAFGWPGQIFYSAHIVGKLISPLIICNISYKSVGQKFAPLH